MIPGQTAVVHDAVAIIIATVADFHGRGINGGIGIVTVTGQPHVTGRLHNGRGGYGRIAVSVTVQVFIPSGTAFVRITVTVVISTVADFRGGGIDGGIGIIAVTGHGDITGRLSDRHHGNSGSVIIAIVVLVPDGTAFVDTAGTVVVNTVVAHFSHTRIDGRIGIVTVTGSLHVPGRGVTGIGRNRRVAVTVSVTVFIPGDTPFIRIAVTIIVDTVGTDFLGAGINGGIGVIAIQTIVHIPDRLNRGRGRNGGIAVAVAVTVLVPGHAAFIHDAVTIAVHAIADFGRARVDGSVAVVAVITVRHEPGRLLEPALGDTGIAVAVAVDIPVPGQTAFVHTAGTVVVQAVAADFRCIRIDGGIGIVTVTGERHVADRLGTAVDDHGRVAEAVTIRVPVP